MIALLSLSAYAQTVAHPVTICVDYDVEFTDNGNEDFWTDNSIDRPARGVQIQITDDAGFRERYVDDITGCYDTDVEIGITNKAKEYTVGVVTRASQKGVPYEVHVADTPQAGIDDDVIVETYIASAIDPQVNIVTTSNIEWQVMAAASWIFHRNRFNRTSGPSRDCCVAPHAAADGTCGTPSHQYAPPVTDTLHYYVDSARDDCPGGGGNNHQGQLNSVNLLSTCPSKWLIAHETGHALVGMRMADVENGWSTEADLDNCMADFWPNGDEVDPDPDPMGRPDRGLFTKEYGSQAFREGWAEFFAAWAWNSRQQSDCTFVNRGYYSDFDLDGSVDNDFLRSPYNDFEIDCAGNPWMGLTSSPVTDGVNWLDDLESAADLAGCVRTTATHNGHDLEDNRATVWDVTRMFWELTSDPVSPIGPAKLSDLYVDMCPRSWADVDDWTAAGALPRQPLERLFESASHHSTIETRVDNAANDHLVH
jgi:hypothetical protein